MTSLRSQVLHPVEPDLVDRRGDLSLLVWGGLAQWMVVDDDVVRFLQAFRGGSAVAQALSGAADGGEPGDPAAVAEVVDALLARGVLRAGPAPEEPRDEPLLISNVTMNLTNACNLTCRWCYNRSRTGHLVPVGVVEGALMEARREGVLDEEASLALLGGEPTMDQARLLEAIDRLGPCFRGPVLVSTNGTLVSRALARELARRSVEVQVSVDGPAPEGHDAVRGPGTHARALRGARHLIGSGAHVILSMVYTSENWTELEAYLDLALELGAREARFVPMRCMGRGLDLRSLMPDQRVVARHLLAVLERRPELARLLVRDWFSITATMLRSSTRRVSCGVGRRVILVDADGALYPCPNHVEHELCLGRIGEVSLSGVLHGRALSAMRAACRVDASPNCSRCPFRPWCAGDCRGEVRALGGSPADPSPHCRELKALFTELLWLSGSGRLPLGAGALPASSQHRHG